MADKKQRKSDSIDRYFAGIIYVSCLITIIGSALAGCRIIEITWRVTLVFAVLSIAKRIIIRSWDSWQETMHSGGGQATRQSKG